MDRTIQRVSPFAVTRRPNCTFLRPVTDLPVSTPVMCASGSGSTPVDGQRSLPRSNLPAGSSTVGDERETEERTLHDACKVLSGMGYRSPGALPARSVRAGEYFGGVEHDVSEVSPVVLVLAHLHGDRDEFVDVNSGWNRRLFREHVRAAM